MDRVGGSDAGILTLAFKRYTLVVLQATSPFIQLNQVALRILGGVFVQKAQTLRTPFFQANIGRGGYPHRGQPKSDVAHVSVEFRSRCGSTKGTRAARRRPHRVETAKRNDLHNRKTLREGVGRILGRSPETAEVQPPRPNAA